MDYKPSINIKNVKNTLYYRRVPMVDVSIDIPELYGSVPINTAIKFNKYYIYHGRKMFKYAKYELYPKAVTHYKQSKRENFPFHQYSLVSKVEITYKERNMVSLYFDTYEYTGGAHGLTTRTSDTWSLKDARILSLKDLFGKNKNYNEIILKEILRQAKEKQEKDENFYFDNLEANIKKNYDPNNFYLKPKGVVIYYPLYSIAPYAAGIQEFLIPYSLLDC